MCLGANSLFPFFNSAVCFDFDQPPNFELSIVVHSPSTLSTTMPVTPGDPWGRRYPLIRLPSQSSQLRIANAFVQERMAISGHVFHVGALPS